jgi:hypothetical protein
MKNRITKQPMHRDIKRLVADLNAAGVPVTTGDKTTTHPQALIQKQLEKIDRLHAQIDGLQGEVLMLRSGRTR